MVRSSDPHPAEPRTTIDSDDRSDKNAEQSDSESKRQQDPEHEEAKERQAPSGSVVYKAICKEGADELERPSSALFWSGIAAGLSMGFSMIAEGALRAHLPDAPWRPLVAKLGYSVGFLIVVLGRQQLFTENTLTPVLPLLSHRGKKELVNVLRLWGIVLVTNLAGAAAVGAVAAGTHVFSHELREAFVSLGHEAVEPGFGLVLARGVFAGWLIALMVWLLPFAEVARVYVIIIITYVIGIGQFSHVIAGCVEVSALAAGGGASWGHVFGSFIVPALIGNILGGVTLVAALNYAQVNAGGGQDS